jgi:ABC-2 type transport system ATP-binding protein
MIRSQVIKAKDLTRRFGQTTAVDQLTLKVYAGEVFGFLGHNGAGKTTTIRLFNGILTPDGGTVELLGQSPLLNGPAVRSQTGVLTESPSLDERLTGRENLTFSAAVFDVPGLEVADRVSRLLDTFDLADRAAEKVGGYSKGMKQRLSLARALLHEPEILFLDEPTASLDPVAAQQVHQIIKNLSREKGKTVFICTHNLAEAHALCDRVGVMENGQLIALGTPAELASRLNPSNRLDIQVDINDKAAAMTAFQDKSFSFDAPSDDGVFTLLGAERSAIPDIVSDLVFAGVRIYQITPHEPSLADVYFALHKHKERVG